MSPPKDPISLAAGAFKEARPWEVYRQCVWVSNAPHNFYIVVRDKMLTLAFRPHTLDVCLYLFWIEIEPATEEQMEQDIWICMAGQKYRLEAAVLYQVDDMLGTFSPDFDHTPLREAFSWGSEWEWAPKPFNRNGHDLRFDERNRVTVHQTTFTKGTRSRPVPNSNRRDPTLQKGPEMTEYKSCGRSMNWLATETRMDLAAASSLSQKSEPTLSDLRSMYKILDYQYFQRSAAEARSTFSPAPFNKGTVVDYSDSSWANAETYKSQMGFIVFLTTFAALTIGAFGSIMSYKSFRSKRVVRSTLAAEASAKDCGVDYATFMNAFLSELLTAIRAKNQAPAFQHYSVTDCKSLYDAVRQATPSLSEKRTIIDLTATREALAKDHLLWVPTSAMLADGLTKLDFGLMKTLTRLMSHTWLNLKGAES